MSCSVNSVSILYDVAPLAANYMPIVLQENAVLEITAQAAQFQATFEIKHPDAENRALLRLRDIRQKAWQQEQQGLRPESEADEHALLDHEAALLRFQQPMMAFADSSASWPHSSHLSGDATPFMTALRITTIPANFILDAQGKVIAKNLHGEALRVFIEDYLK